jgi:hypothetical protein
LALKGRDKKKTSEVMLRDGGSGEGRERKEI